MSHLFVWTIALCVVCCLSEEDRQTWSTTTKLGIDVEIACNNTFDWGIHVEPVDRIEWRKKDMTPNLQANDKFEFLEMYGINKMHLKIKGITQDDGGVYLCDVYTLSGDFRGTIVKGVNIGTYVRDTDIDKYREGIVTGVIAGASVFVLIVGVALLDNFRYLTDEQKQKRANRKYIKSGQQSKVGGHVNDGAEFDMHEDSAKNGQSKEDEQVDGNTHF